MFHRLTRPALLALALALGTAPAALAQTEIEPNGTLAQATVLSSTNTIVTGTFTTGSIDMDYFRFTLTESTNVSIRLWGATIGVCPNSAMDPTLNLFNAGGQPLADNDDAGSLCPLLDATTQPIMGSLPAGTYYLLAKSLFAPASQQPYTLVIETNPAPVPITESFTYQGKLDSAGQPVNGETQMFFSLWSHPTSTVATSRLSLPIQYSSVGIINGLFSVDLDFTIPNAPANYDGTERYLQIEIADLNGSGNRTVLEPRQRLAPTPHAIHAIRAGRAARATLADNATHAGTASNADYAGFAQDAASASTANTAASAAVASNVPWSGITGKPAEFADNDDATGGWTEVTASGLTYTSHQVGINTSLPGSFDLAVAGTAAKTGGGSWSVFSDERLKHDIKPMNGTLDRLLQLRGYTYEYNAEAVTNRLALPGTQIGLLAQEVERVFPDWVATDAQGYRYVTERATTALMVEALRDLRTEKDAEIDALNARIERLEQALDALSNK